MAKATLDNLDTTLQLEGDPETGFEEMIDVIGDISDIELGEIAQVLEQDLVRVIEAETAPTGTKPKKTVVKREKSTSKKGHYIDNDDLLATVIRDKQTGVLSNKLAKYLMMISERFSRSPSYIMYSYREDMVSAANLNLCANWHKFDPAVSSNPFAFYTTSVYRSFLNYLAKERDERNTRDALRMEMGSNPSFGFQDRSKGGVDSYSSDDTAFTTSVQQD